MRLRVLDHSMLRGPRRVPPRVVLDSPYVLIGDPGEIAAQLHDHHARFGITRFSIFADRPDLQPGEELAAVLRELGDA